VALPFRPATGPATRRRRQFLSREEIVEAGAKVLARDGYDALNMRSVATELDVQAAALYRYVDSREELDDLLFDHLMADCVPGLDGDDWRADLRAFAAAWRIRLTTTRDATRIALGQVSIGPNIAPLMDVALSILRRSGLDDDDLIEVYQACMLLVHSLASAEASYLDLAAKTGAGGLRYAPPQPEWVASYPTLWALAERLAAPPDFDARFAFGLDALIAGVERRLAGE
jgi:TetR/AcrR family tetracycline transcriptional repressor